MGLLKWLFGDKDSHSQTANGSNNRQYQDNRRYQDNSINVRHGGGSECIYGGFPSLQKCDGAFGPGCKYQWNCPAYRTYLNNLHDD
jgi:hypothetical protein